MPVQLPNSNEADILTVYLPNCTWIQIRPDYCFVRMELQKDWIFSESVLPKMDHSLFLGQQNVALQKNVIKSLEILASQCIVEYFTLLGSQAENLIIRA